MGVGGAERIPALQYYKLLLADGEQASFGGCNIGDRYVGFSHGFNFVDFDALITGPAAYRRTVMPPGSTLMLKPVPRLTRSPST